MAASPDKRHMLIQSRVGEKRKAQSPWSEIKQIKDDGDVWSRANEHVRDSPTLYARVLPRRHVRTT
jgi:hypothetical protein